MNSYLLKPLVYILSTVFTLYIVVVMLRLIFQYIRADFYNPLSQFVVKVTSPVLIPIRRIVPAMGKTDTASIVLLLLLQLVLQSIIQLLQGVFSVSYIIFISLANLINIFLYIYEFAIILTIIVSWVNPGVYNPTLSLIDSMTHPVMKHFRKLLPPISGIDFSPMFAIISIEVIRMLLIPPIQSLALRM